jgi:hypothetical protein
MKRIRTTLIFTVLLLPAAAGAAAAQATPGAQQPGTPQPAFVSPPPGSFNDLACAPHLTLVPPDGRLRVSGSMDTFLKQMMGPPDVLVISAGLQQGLQVGQEFFVRRLPRNMGARGPDRDHPLAVHTAGWIKLVEVGPVSSTASITHACEGIMLNDYLEPFVPPLVAATQIDGTPRLEHLGHVMMGDEGRTVIAVGEFTTIDRGSDHGIMNGQRFTVYRDTGSSAAYRDMTGPARSRGTQGSPGLLVEVGAIVAVSVRPESSTAQVVEARDSIRQDDFVAIRR